MKRIWFVTNPNSGSTDSSKAEAIEALFAERGLVLVGQTDFLKDKLPTPDVLDKAKVDTAILFAGDGTINAVVCALAEWSGAILILPGGTMNMLAKILHGDKTPSAIIEAALTKKSRVALPFVEAGTHRGLVGVILGPAANWFRPREVVRAGKLGQLLPTMRLAWRRTFGRGITLVGAPGFPAQAQGAYVHAVDDHLQVVAFNARDFRAIADLGWSWLAGDWLQSRAVTDFRAKTLRVAQRRPVLALFDGEPATLGPDTEIKSSKTRDQFITTIGQPE